MFNVFFSADATGKKLPGLLVCTFFGQKKPRVEVDVVLSAEFLVEFGVR